MDEKELGHLLVNRPDPFPVITASRLDGLCIRPIGFSQRPVAKRAGTGGPRSLTCMGQLWTHTLRRLGSLGPDSELETCFLAVSGALWDRFCNNEQVQAWAEGKAELRCNWKLLLMATELGWPFNIVPNCIPGPVTNTGGPHRGWGWRGVIQDKVMPSLQVQSLEGDSAVSHQQPPNLAAGEGMGAWSLREQYVAQYPWIHFSP